MIASLLFMGGLRRSEVSALEWRDVSDASDSDGVLLTVRTSKTNQEGDAAPTDRVIGLSPIQIQRRFTAAARAAGIEARVTAHSGRIGKTLGAPPSPRTRPDLFERLPADYYRTSSTLIRRDRSHAD